MTFKKGKFSVAIPVYRRVALLPYTIQRWLDMGVSVVVVASRQEDLKVIESFGDQILVVQHENFPLGAKWNAGFKQAKEIAEYVIFAGSTDWVMPQYLMGVLLNPDYNYYGALGCSWLEFYKSQPPNISLWPGYHKIDQQWNPGNNRSNETIGIGRVLESTLVDRLFQEFGGPFDGKLHDSLDGSMRRRIENLRAMDNSGYPKEKILPTKPFELTSLSCPEVWQNKHRIEHTINWSTRLEWGDCVKAFPEAKQLFEDLKNAERDI